MTFEWFHENPAVLHVGTCPPRSWYTPAESVDASLAGESARKVELNGTWAFHFAPNPSALLDDHGGFLPIDEDQMDTIPVPACWQNHGYDRHQYTNIRFPIPYDPPYVPEENPCGLYVRHVEITEADLALRNFLNFEGVDSCFYLWINGVFAGYSQVSHSVSEFEITDLLQPGNNRITVLVLKWCDGTYLEDQDKLRMSGIFGSVYLLQRPEAFLADYFVTQHFAADYRTADLQISLSRSAPCPVTATLYDPAGTPLQTVTTEGDALSFSLSDPILWNAEQPLQYTLLLQTPGEAIRQKTGLRHIVIRDRVVLLNGQIIKFKGVNRHDSDPVTGYSISKAQALTDLALMKQHNINAIRTSHYPCHPWFMELCGDYGFYVIGEADIECHGTVTSSGVDDQKRFSLLAEDPQFEAAILDRVQRNVIRDKNQCAAVIWSLGNESGYGENFVKAAKWIHSYDPSRLVHYESEHYPLPGKQPDATVLDLYSRMYPSTSEVAAYLENPENTRPFILCEFAHAMGNGPGDLADYLALMYQHDNFCGGFVWEWCDHAVYGGTTKDGKPVYRYGGDFDELLHDGNFCMDGLVYPDRRVHTGLLEYKNCLRPVLATYDPLLGITITNTLDFLNLEDTVSLQYEMQCNGAVLAEGSLPTVHLAPHEATTLPLPVVLPETDGDITLTLFYRAAAAGPFYEAGYELGFDSFLLQAQAPVLPAPTPGAVTIRETPRAIWLSALGFQYRWNPATGLFDALVSQNNPLLNAPMEWNLYRAPMDNDQYIRRRWEEKGYHRPTVRVYRHSAVSTAHGAACITAELGIAAVSIERFIDVSITWEIDCTGLIRCDMQVQRDPSYPYLPRFGLRMFLPAHFDQADYYGYGPQESYIDKHQASRLGRYAAPVAAFHEDYLRPQENGSHYGCRDVSISSDTCQLTAQSAAPFCFNLSPYTQEMLTNTAHAHDLTPAGCTVFCLDYLQSGCGSNSCGPELAEKYQLCQPSFSFSFALSAHAKEQRNP